MQGSGYKKGNKLVRYAFAVAQKIGRGLRYVFVEPLIRRTFGGYGSSVRILKGNSFSGAENIYVGNRVSFGEGMRILSTKAKLIVGDDVMFGPGVTVITGDHRIDVLGKYMNQLKDSDKLPQNDMDVVIEKDVWIGANSTILKGVTIGRGCVVAAGSVVTKSCPAYSIIGGVPAKVLKSRFTPQQIQEHERLLQQ